MTVQEPIAKAGVFDHIPPLMLFEEERLPMYNAENFYPVRIGDVFNSDYRVVARLGFGTASTVWLCHSAKTGAYHTLKFCTVDHEKSNELLISEHIRSIKTEHPGLASLRMVVDNFKVDGSKGQHQCLLFDPLGLTFTEFRKRLPGGVFGKTLMQQSLLLILLGLDFLHQVGIVHTDLSPNNILLGVEDSTVFQDMENSEEVFATRTRPSGTRIVYRSQAMPVTSGALVISDFGAAHLGVPGQNFTGDVMPNFYRAPEIILSMPWNSRIDIWSIGVIIWDLFEEIRLFYAVQDGKLSDEQHLAEMVSLLGQPPQEFLERSEKCDQYWDSQGRWIAKTPIPEQSIETRETRLDGADKKRSVALARKIFRWLPEDRPSAEDLLSDEFLLQYQHM